GTDSCPRSGSLPGTPLSECENSFPALTTAGAADVPEPVKLAPGELAEHAEARAARRPQQGRQLAYEYLALARGQVERVVGNRPHRLSARALRKRGGVDRDEVLGGLPRG